MKKSLLLLLSLVMGVTTAFAGIVDVTWGGQSDWSNNANAQKPEEKVITLTVGDITLSLDKAAGQTSPTVNKGKNDARLYAKGQLKLTASGKSVTSILFSISEQGMKRMGDLTAASGTVETDMTAKTVTWTGNAAEVLITVGDQSTVGSEKGAAQLCFTQLQVTLDDGQVLVAAPTISGETDFEGTTEVKIEGEEGTTIYYTLDNSDPTVSSTLTGPSPLTFTLDKSATVKAIAVKGEDVSSVSSKAFTAHTYEEVTIADLNEYSEDKADLNLKLTDAQVTYVDGKNFYLREGDKALMVFNSSLSVAVGDVLNGTVKVDYDNYYGIHEVKDNASTNMDNLTKTSGDAPLPVIVEIGHILEYGHIAEYIELQKVTIEYDETAQKYFAVKGDARIQFNKGIDVSDYADGNEYYVTAVFNNIYKNVAQIQPIAVSTTPTGISTTVVAPVTEGQAIYSIDGRRLVKAVKGLNIINGNKVLVK